MMTAAPPRRRFPILIAEDNSVSRKYLVRILKTEGYDVVWAENGRAALEVFNDRFFPIILTDWVMPEMNGPDLCRSVRAQSDRGYVFIILLTAKDSPEDIITGLEAGADDFLTKPFYHGELLSRINSGVRILELERSLKNANEEIRLLSITDPLTGAYNRGYLTDRLPEEMARAVRDARPLSVILCDIDHFKNVNDTHGHQVGDQVLKEFVGLIRLAFRDKTDWVSRYGGEEFLIVLPETDAEDAIIVAETFRRTVADRQMKLAGKTVSVTASFGVAGFDPTRHHAGILSDDLIRAADTHLYRAKHGGRNRVVGSEFATIPRLPT